MDKHLGRIKNIGTVMDMRCQTKYQITCHMGGNGINQYNEIAFKKKRPKRNRLGCKSVGVLSLGVLLLFTGCGKQVDSDAKLHLSRYAIKQYETVTVKKQDIVPRVECKLKVGDFQVISYRASEEELTVDKIYVSIGDVVKKGQVLVSFQSDELDAQKEEVAGQIRQAQETLNHLQKVAQIDNTKENREAVSDQQVELSILRTKESEIGAKLASYSIIAKEAGTITKMDESLKAGVVNNEATLLEENCGSDDYVTNCQEVKFKVGEEYVATFGVAEYKMKVVKIDEDGTVHFSPKDQMKEVSVADDLDLVIEKKPLKQVIAVPSNVINHKTDTKGDYTYVRVVNKDGYPSVKEVTVSQQVLVDGLQLSVIESGLSGGECIVIP